MVKLAHGYHRLVQWTLIHPIAVVPNYGHIGVGRSQ